MPNNINGAWTDDNLSETGGDDKIKEKSGNDTLPLRRHLRRFNGHKLGRGAPGTAPAPAPAPDTATRCPVTRPGGPATRAAIF